MDERGRAIKYRGRLSRQHRHQSHRMAKGPMAQPPWSVEVSKRKFVNDYDKGDKQGYKSRSLFIYLLALIHSDISITMYHYSIYLVVINSTNSMCYCKLVTSYATASASLFRYYNSSPFCGLLKSFTVAQVSDWTSTLSRLF
jgi:hypothetical protein